MDNNEPKGGQILLYQTSSGDVRVECRLQDETIWLTQKAIASLFGVQVPAVSKHLRHIFDTGELLEEATVSKMETVRSEGAREVRREVDFYNLDVIIAVGYRVNSYQATQFRIWATKTLKAEQEYEVFRQRQDRDYLSDFDREIKRLQGGNA